MNAHVYVSVSVQMSECVYCMTVQRVSMCVCVCLCVSMRLHAR
jgi:hypothetical protein